MDFSSQRKIDDAAAASEDFDKRVGTPLSATAMAPCGTPGEYAREATALTTSASVLAPVGLVMKRARDAAAFEALKKTAGSRLGSLEELQLLELPIIAPQVLTGRVSSKSAVSASSLSIGGREYAWLAGKSREGARTLGGDSAMLIPDAILIGSLEAVEAGSAEDAEKSFTDYFVARYVSFNRDRLSDIGEAAYRVVDEQALSAKAEGGARERFADIAKACPRLLEKLVHLGDVGSSRSAAGTVSEFEPSERILRFINREAMVWALTRAIDRNVLGYAVSAASAASGAGDALRAISVASGHGSGILDRCASLSSATVTSGDIEPEELLAMLRNVPKAALASIRIRAVAALSSRVGLEEIRVLLQLTAEDYDHIGVRLTIDGAVVCKESQAAIITRLVRGYEAKHDRDDGGAPADDGASIAVARADVMSQLSQYLTQHPVELDIVKTDTKVMVYDQTAAESFIRAIAPTLTSRVGEQLAVSSNYLVVGALLRLLSITNAATIAMVHSDVSDLISSELAAKRRAPLSYEYVLLLRLAIIANHQIGRANARAKQLGFSSESELARWLASNHGRNSYDAISIAAAADAASSSKFNLRRRKADAGDGKIPIYPSDRQFELVARYAYVARKTLPEGSGKLGDLFSASLRAAFASMHVKPDWIDRLTSDLDRLFVAGESATSGIADIIAKINDEDGHDDGRDDGPDDDAGGTAKPARSSASSGVLSPDDADFLNVRGFQTINELLSRRTMLRQISATLDDAKRSTEEYAAAMREQELAKEKTRVATLLSDGAPDNMASVVAKAASELHAKSPRNTLASIRERFDTMLKAFTESKRVSDFLASVPDSLSAPFTPAEENVLRHGLLKGTYKPEAARANEAKMAYDIFERRLASARADDTFGGDPLKWAGARVSKIIDEFKQAFVDSAAAVAKTQPKGAMKRTRLGDSDYSSDESDDSADGPAGGKGRASERAAADRRDADMARGAGKDATNDSKDFAKAFAISAEFGNNLLSAGLTTLEVLAWFSLSANTALQQGTRYGTTAQVTGMATRLATLVNGLTFASTEVQLVFSPARLDLCPSLDVVGPVADEGLRGAFARGTAVLLRRGVCVLTHRTDCIHSSLHTLGSGLAWYANSLLNVFPGRYHQTAAATNQDEAFYVGYICARGAALPELYELCMDIILTGSGAVHTARIFAKLPAVASILGHAYSAARVLQIMATEISDKNKRDELVRESTLLQTEFKRAYSQRFRYGGAAGYISGERTDIEGLKVALKGPIARALACLMATRDRNLEDLRKAPSAGRFLRSNALEAMEVSALSSYFWASYKSRVHGKAIANLTSIVGGSVPTIEDG